MNHLTEANKKGRNRGGYFYGLHVKKVKDKQIVRQKSLKNV